MLRAICVLTLMSVYCCAQDATLLRKKLADIHYKSGRVTILDGIATLNLPPAFHFADAQGAKVLLIEAWGNPESVASNTVGIIAPANLDLLDSEAWAINITYAAEGYIKDAEADQINYAELLQGMKEGARKESEARKKQGFPAFEIVGWAAPPHYDSSTHKLYWAKELKFAESPENTLNYDIRVLGRRGFLAFNAIASKHQLASVEAGMGEILRSVEFNQGHRYADYVPSADKVAVYGIGALIAGKVALKVGLLKWLIGILIASKKLIFIALAGMGSFFARLFRRKSQKQKQEAEMQRYAQELKKKQQATDEKADTASA